MFLLSFVLEDWAIHELVPSPRQRRLAVTLVVSSYVTWTYQTHTFSNAVETLIVLWSIVMIQRILDKNVSPSLCERALPDHHQHRSNLVSSAILGVLITTGIFNRITFPAFLLVPGCFLLPHFRRRPLSPIVLILTTALTTFLAVSIDTSFYNPPAAASITTLLRTPTLTPLNSLLYNTSTSNLSLHGLHPPYQHLLFSLPLLLGPALPLFLARPRLSSLTSLSALTGTAILSLIPHQEPRFLLPTIPLILSTIQLPRSRALTRCFLAAWLVFNATLGILMGIYHQGGVIPAQIWLGEQENLGLTEVLWWRTYSPPIWLLGGNNLTTTDLMGMDFASFTGIVDSHAGGCRDVGLGLVAPASSVELDAWKEGGREGAQEGEFVLEEVWRYGRHLNLDDLDVGGEGVWGTVRRVVGRRGLVVWRVGRRCVGEGAWIA